MNRIINILSHKITLRILKYAFVGMLIYTGFHLFNLNYQIVNSNGIHGLVSRATMRENANDHAKATVFDSIPEKYIMDKYEYSNSVQ